MFRFLASVFILMVCVLGSATAVEAQSEAGIGLSPAIIEEPMDPGAVKQFSITVSNLSGQDQIYYLYKRDITGVRDGSIPVFAEESLDKTGFELSEWISLTTDTLAVPIGGQANLDFSISVPDNASPGSHFGGVFVSVEPPRLRASGAAVGYEVGNIISIRVSGDVNENAQIRQFSTDNYFYGKSEVTFSARIENSGNTLVRPRGPLQITNMFGSEVGQLMLNDSAAGVFPYETREFTAVWKGDSPGFGRYEALLSAQYGEDGAKKTISSTVTFWILPMNIIGPALGVLATLLLVTYIGVRVYVKQKLAFYTATGGTRRLVRRRKESGSSIFFLVFIVMLVVTALFLIVLLALFS